MARSDWMTTEETAHYLGIGKSKLYDLAQAGEIPRHKVGQAWKFYRTDLDSWVRAGRSLDEFFTTIDYEIEENDELRDPQREAHAATLEHFTRSMTAAILQLPVGCGKSGLIALLPLGLAHGRVLVISPNITIRDSLYADLNITDRRNCFWRRRSVLSPETLLAGPHVAVLDGKDANIHDCEKSHIVLTNIQQLASSADRWLPNFEDDFFDLILVDEGHHSAAKSWEKVFDRFANAKVVNLTATPYRADDKEITGQLVYRYSFKRAMVKGYIKRLQAIYVAPSELTFSYEGTRRPIPLMKSCGSRRRIGSVGASPSRQRVTRILLPRASTAWSNSGRQGRGIRLWLWRCRLITPGPSDLFMPNVDTRLKPFTVGCRQRTVLRCFAS